VSCRCTTKTLDIASNGCGQEYGLMCFWILSDSSRRNLLCKRHSEIYSHWEKELIHIRLQRALPLPAEETTSSALASPNSSLIVALPVARTPLIWLGSPRSAGARALSVTALSRVTPPTIAP